MKNFNADTAKQIVATVLPKIEEKNRRKAKREYKDIKKLIYSTAKHGGSSINLDYLPLEPEVYQWLEKDGFKIEHIQTFHVKISWD